MDTKTYLTAFSKGPCSPVINVPSMTSGRIFMDMICSKAKQNYAEVWKTCGWFIPCNTKNVQIFPPTPSFIASFVGSNPKNGMDNFLKCFVALFGLSISLDKDGVPRYYAKEGMSPRPQWEGAYHLGSVERKQSCGFRANNKTVSGPPRIEKLQANYLGQWWDEYEHLGYRANISVFNYAYDWRMDANNAAKNWKFTEMAETLFALTGKKIVVAGHSYGVNVGYEGIYLIPKKRRQQIIKSFISYAGPWLGAYSAFDQQSATPMGAIFAKGGMLEMPAQQYREMMASLGVLYTLMPKDTFHRFSNTDWMKKTLNMVNYYKGKSITKNPFDWMPTRSELCGAKELEISNTGVINGTAIPGVKTYMACNFGYQPYEKFTIVGKKIYKFDQIQDFLNKHSAVKDASVYFKHWNTYQESGFENFGIITYFIAQNNVPTTLETTWAGVNSDGRTLNLNGPKTRMGYGDQTVPFASLLGPAFKWAEEFNPKDSTTAPVKIIHYCNNLSERSQGTYKTKANWEAELKANKNSYLGLPCICGTPDFYAESLKGGPGLENTCTHSGGFNDPSWHHFQSIIIIDTKDAGQGLSKFAQELDYKYLDDMVSHCMIEKPYFLESWRKNFQTKDRSFLQRNDASWRRRLATKKD